MDGAVIQERIVIFLLVWTVSIVLTGLFFRSSHPVSLKEKSFPWIGAYFATVFAAGTLYLGVPSDALWIIIPVLLFLIHINLRLTFFCHRCGTFNASQPPFRKAKACRKCGHPRENTPL